MPIYPPFTFPQIYSYNTQNNKYLNPNDVFYIESGKGYWIWFDKETTLSIEGISGATSPFLIALKKGWNLIGNPFDINIKWDDSIKVDFEALSRSTKLESTLIEYEGNNKYKSANQMLPWKAYWLKAKEDTVLSIPNTVPSGNHAPIANAGVDQRVIPGVLVTLDSSASLDPDGDIITYSWQRTAGTFVTLSSLTASSPTFQPTNTGIYTFNLTVSDGLASATDTVNIIVYLAGDATDGTQKWVFDTGGAIYSSPAIGQDGTVYISVEGNKFYAINPDGTQKWVFNNFLSVEKISQIPPAIGSDGNIYINSSATLEFFEGDITRSTLNIIGSDGAMKNFVDTEGKTNSSPAIGVDGTIYVNSSGDKFYAINPDGTQKWTFSSDDGTPMIGPDGTIYVGIYALNQNGSQKATVTQPLAIDTDGNLYSYANEALSVRYPSGVAKWSFSAGRTNFSYAVIGTEGTVYTGGFDSDDFLYKLYAISSAGTQKWAFTIGSLDSNPSVPAIGADGTIYVGSLDNKFYAINSDGTIKWIFDTGSPVYSSPAINKDGTIYFGTEDGQFYAIYSDSKGLASSPWPKFQHDNQNTGAMPYTGQINHVPRVDAGVDQTVLFGLSVTLDGSASIDPDGDDITYLWSQKSGPSVTLSNSADSKPTFIPSTASATYIFNLTVIDNKGGRASDTVTVTILPADYPGTVKWTFITGSDVVSSPAIGTDGTIYVGSYDSKLYAINPDGTQKWAFVTIFSILSSPSISTDGTIYIGSVNRLYAVNPDGTQKWYFTADETIGSSPAIGAGGAIYIIGYNPYATAANKLYRLNPDGTKKWSFTIGSATTSSPAVGTDGTIYFCSGKKELYAINSDGTLKWIFTGDKEILNNSPAIGADGTIYISSSTDTTKIEPNELYAINPDGTVKWTLKIGALNSNSPVIGTDDTIYVESVALIYAIKPDGFQKWSHKVGYVSGSSPTIGADGVIYVGIWESLKINNYYKTFYRLYALNFDGTQKWFVDAGGQILSSAAIGADGVVYFGSRDNKLYAVYSSSKGLANSSWPKFMHDNRNTGGQ